MWGTIAPIIHVILLHRLGIQNTGEVVKRLLFSCPPTRQHKSCWAWIRWKLPYKCCCHQQTALRAWCKVELAWLWALLRECWTQSPCRRASALRASQKSTATRLCPADLNRSSIGIRLETTTDHLSNIISFRRKLKRLLLNSQLKYENIIYVY